MTLRKWQFEITAGTAFTRATIVADDGAIPTHFGTNSGTMTYLASTSYAKGTTSIKAENASGAAGYIIRFPFVAATKQAAFRFYHGSAAPPAATIIANVRHTTTDGVLFKIILFSDGKIGVRDVAGVTVGTSAGAMTFGILNRFECVFTIGTSTTGAATVNVYAGDGTTPVATVAVTGVNLGTANAVTVELGAPDVVTAAWAQNFDSVAVNDGATVEIGPEVVTVVLAAPVLTVTSTNPSTAGASDGTIVASWGAVASAVGYESCILVGSVVVGAVSTRSSSALTRTFTGLAAGTYTVAVRAV